MRVRVSIPAWAKLPLASFGTVVVIGLITAPIWRPRVDQCAVITENLDAVRSGFATSRASDAWVRHDRREKYGWSRSVVVGERGEFGGFVTQFTLRACLGSEWTERRSEGLHPGWVSEAWVYERPEWPDVYYLAGIDGGARSQIMIVQHPQ